MQYCGNMKVVPISKRGTITLPPAYRKKLGIEDLDNPLMLVEEEGGKLTMELAQAVPVRDISKETIEGWIAEDEVDGKNLKKKRSRK